eukprot:XP_001704034.1 Hypothetical protein GL50803_38196 [Giardia lamblia ATCC 50803]
MSRTLSALLSELVEGYFLRAALISAFETAMGGKDFFISA